MTADRRRHRVRDAGGRIGPDARRGRGGHAGGRTAAPLLAPVRPVARRDRHATSGADPRRGSDPVPQRPRARPVSFTPAAATAARRCTTARSRTTGSGAATTGGCSLPTVAASTCRSRSTAGVAGIATANRGIPCTSTTVSCSPTSARRSASRRSRRTTSSTACPTATRSSPTTTTSGSRARPRRATGSRRTRT